jgi:hypothetical protein
VELQRFGLLPLGVFAPNDDDDVLVLLLLLLLILREEDDAEVGTLGTESGPELIRLEPDLVAEPDPIPFSMDDELMLRRNDRFLESFCFLLKSSSLALMVGVVPPATSESTKLSSESNAF